MLFQKRQAPAEPEPQFTMLIIRRDGTGFDAPAEAQTLEDLLGLLTEPGMIASVKRVR